MSISGTITIIFNNFNNNLLELFNSFFEYGWTLGCYEKIEYLPLGDEDFDWKIEDIINKDKVMQIIINKYKQNELIGIVFTWKSTNIGITSLIYSNLEKVTFSLNINRKTLENTKITDYSWYIEKIIPIFIKLGFSYERIECIEA